MMKFSQLVGLITSVITFNKFATSSNFKPNIIFILADDLGWNDVSFHGSPQIPTPNIDALAASGVVLQNYYAAPQCSPSRGSLMTGKYTVNTGLQHYVLLPGEPTGLPLNFTILPQYLKNLGYRTAMVGKWHLGYSRNEYTPLYRGFDKFYGCLNGQLDHFDYTIYANYTQFISWGIDLYDGKDIQRNIRGQYATDLFTDKAIDMIENHNTKDPLFLYVSHIAPHYGNSYDQLQVKPEDAARFNYIKDRYRRGFAGMMGNLDDNVGRIFSALFHKDMLSNSIVIFVSDNGGTSMDNRIGPASNYPLRGEKLSLWEGGVRVPALIWSPILGLTEPVTSEKLMHVSDWLPTLYAAGGGDVKDLIGIEGFNMWPGIADRNVSPRHEVLLNIDNTVPISAIRVGDYKLIQGDYPGIPNKWNGTSGKDVKFGSSLDAWVWKNGSEVKSILERVGRWLINTPDSWRLNLTVHCGQPPNNACDSTKGPCLFNIVQDPCEYHDLSHLLPSLVIELKERIQHFNATSLPSLSEPVDIRSLPTCYGFAHVPWLDKEYKNNCPYF